MVRRPVRSLQRWVDDRRRARIARLPLDQVDLPEQLDHPAFGALAEDEQNYRRRRAVAVLARRQRRRAISVTVGALIFTVTLIASLIAEQQLHDAQIAEQKTRTEQLAREQAARAHDAAVGRYNQCVGINMSLGRIRDGIIASQPNISTAGVTDPSTLARIETTNRQHAQTRAFFRHLIPNVDCGPRP